MNQAARQGITSSPEPGWKKVVPVIRVATLFWPMP